jgi:site-specific recombinase XerC
VRRFTASPRQLGIRQPLPLAARQEASHHLASIDLHAGSVPAVIHPDQVGLAERLRTIQELLGHKDGVTTMIYRTS